MRTTPTEVETAWEAGADFVKVFPCAQVGGDKYIKALKTALPSIPLIAAGGVNQQPAFILAGATAIGVGTELSPREAIEMRESENLGNRAAFCQPCERSAQQLLPQKGSDAESESDCLRPHKHSSKH